MWEGMDTQEVAKRIVGKRLFVGKSIDIMLLRKKKEKKRKLSNGF
jgi:hypothetical protein